VLEIAAVNDEDLDAGWDELEPEPRAPSRAETKPAKVAALPRDPALDELDASWDAPLPAARVVRPPKRRKERKRDPAARVAPEPPAVVRPRPAAPAPSVTEARRMAKKRAAQTSTERKAERRAKKEEKKRRQAERRAEALAKNKATARGPRAVVRAPEPRRPASVPRRAEPPPAEREETLSRRSHRDEPRERKPRRRRRATASGRQEQARRGGLPRKYAIAGLAVLVLLIALWWLFLRAR
jgi:hypothetical protein